VATISGLDIATYMGVSWMPLGTPPWKWRAITIEAEGGTTIERGVDLARGLRSEYARHGTPDFVAIEAPIANILKNRPGQLDLNIFAGTVTGMLDTLGIPWGWVSIATWRAYAYGKGVKPTGDDNWKDLAIQFAEQSKIQLPSTKKAARDAAESVGVARAWMKCSVPSWHQEAFLSLLTHRQPTVSGPVNRAVEQESLL
jgi:hypothetical protein